MITEILNFLLLNLAGVVGMITVVGPTKPPPAAIRITVIDDKKKKKSGKAAPTPEPPPAAIRITVVDDKKTTSKSKAQPTPTPFTFTGKVEESFEGVKEKETYYVAGKETGRVVTPTKTYERGGFAIKETEEPYAVTTKPSKFVFKRPEGVTEEVTFRESGAEILSSMGVNLPTLFEEPPTRQPGVKGFVGGVISRVKTAESYPGLFTGIQEEVALSFPGFFEKAGAGVEKTWETLRWLGPEQVKWVVGKGREKGILPTKEFYETPKGREAIQTTEFLMLGALVSPAGIGRQAFTETIPLRQRGKPYAVEEIRTAVVEGKPIRYSDYTIFTEKAPPRIQITTTLTRSQMGKAPLEVKYLPKVTSYTGTPFKATAQEPFIVLETTTGKVATISKVTGVSQRLDILKYQKLPSTQQFLVKRLAEAKAGGRPVSDTNILKMFGREDLRFTSQIEVEKLAKMKPDPYFLRLKRELPERGLTTPGKTITRYEAVTEIKTLKETELFEYTKSRIIFKDVTFPGARARGTTPELKVLTKEYKIPEIISEGKTGVEVIKPADIVKTPLGKTFQAQQLQKSLVPKVPPPKTPKAVVTTKTIPSTQQPETISRVVSAYAGTGLYERTTGGQVPRTQLYQTSITREAQFITIQPRLTETQIPRIITKQVSRPMLKETAKEISVAIPKEITKEITKTIQKPMQKQTQKLILKQAQKPISRVPTFFGIPRAKQPVPKQQRPFIPLRFGQPKKMFGTAKYPVLVRRFGKFKIVGYGRTPGEATLIGEERVSKTLARTFLVPGLKPTKIPGYKTKKEKKEGLVFIEPAKRALAAPTEVKEIQMFKRMKGGRKKKRKWV